MMSRLLIFIGVIIAVTACKTPSQEVVLKDIRDIVVDATKDPKLRAKAILYNPNPQRGKLKKVDLEIYVNGKKAGDVNQKLNVSVPSKGEFSVPLEVNLALKEFGLMDTMLSVMGGKKIKVHYKGYIRVNYHGLPIRVPIDYEDDVRLRF
jgi:LEA14-like dessication related protein